MRAINGKIAQFKSGEVGIIKKSKKSTFLRFFFFNSTFQSIWSAILHLKKKSKNLEFLREKRKLLCWIIVKAYEWNCSKQQCMRSSCSLSEKSHEIRKISIVMHECTLKRTFIKLQKESKTQELYAQLE